MGDHSLLGLCCACSLGVLLSQWLWCSGGLLVGLLAVRASGVTEMLRRSRWVLIILRYPGREGWMGVERHVCYVGSYHGG